MSPDRTRVAWIVTLAIGASVLVTRMPAAAQTLPLLRDVPDAVPGSCPAPDADAASANATISPEALQEAARLATEASNAAILGNLASAKNLLERAALLDPQDASIAFRFGRTLEELGDAEAAVREYCRYLTLAVDPPDAADVHAVVRRIAPPYRPGIPDSAVHRFRNALEHADAGRIAEAEHGFTAVIGSAPSWPAGWHNRALVRTAARQRAAARADFMQYLALATDSAARAAVQGWIAQLDAGSVRYNAGTAFAAGLIPGVGHFYTRRPLAGLFFLAAAGGGVAFGVMSKETHVDCLGTPQNGVCPPEQVRGERVERPYLLMGLGAAAAASILGAIDAARGARSRNADVPLIRFGTQSLIDGAHLLVPDMRSTGSAVELALIRFRF